MNIKGCETFEKHFENASSYEFSTQSDDTAAKNMVKFLYTGSLEYSNDTDLVLFMILSNSLKVK
jgi:hypothetical protein